MLAAFASAIAALALASWTAGAQLPEAPSTDSAALPSGQIADLGQLGPVGDVVQEPLPGPVEDVVSDSPVAPVREELRRLVGGGSGGGADGGSGSTSGGAPQPESTPTTSAGSPSSKGGGGSRRGAGDSGDAPARLDTRRRGATSGGAASEADPARAAEGARADTEPSRPSSGGDGLGRTIRNIVRVVPDAVWIALAALLVLALALGARTLVEHRRARSLEREREQLLRDVGLLERALLPAVPERLGGLSASVAYRPASGPAAGGDFYDAFELSPGQAVVLIGDVSGHGREALVRTNSLRSKLRTRLEAGMPPRAALELAGRELASDSGGDFATVAIGVHDPAAGTLTYATAGHPPPILVGPAAHEPVTVASALPLGVGMRTGVRQTTVPLPPGSAACFFTDGLLEARAQGELIGREELTRIVTELGPEQNAEALLDLVIAKADETPDDMAACLVRAVVGADAAPTRLEELELDAEELGLGIGERFLEACRVSADAIAAALEEARGTAATTGGAVLQVAIEDSGGSVTVKAPTSVEQGARPPGRPPVGVAESP